MFKKAAQAGGEQKDEDEFGKNSQPAKHSRLDWTEAVFIALHKGLRCRGFQLFAGLLARRVCRERFFAYFCLGFVVRQARMRMRRGSLRRNFLVLDFVFG